MTRAFAAAVLLFGGGALAQDTARAVSRDSVQLRYADADLRQVVRALAGYLRKPVVAGDIPQVRVTLETPGWVSAELVEPLLRGLLETRSLRLIEDSLLFRIESMATVRPPMEPVAEDAVTLHVIPLRHARANEVAGTINALFGAGAVGQTRFSSPPTLGEELKRLAATTTTSREAPSGPPREVTGGYHIVPEERTNALLLRGTPEDARVVREVVGQLDQRPLQVLLEVLIVELNKDRALDLGVGGVVRSRRGADSLSGTLPTTSAGGLVARFMRMSPDEVALQLNAATTRGDVRVVSRPTVVVTNNAEARFLVGSQRPFVQVSRSLPTDVPVRDQVVQYRDVGTKLNVRPTINQDGYVALLVQQEISGATEETQFGAPIISTREASTEVLVKDGQTIVLGGLSDSTRSRSASGIPVLSSIPFIGALFGQQRRKAFATEFYLFLTPHVIRSDEDIERLTRERRPREVP